MIRKGKGCRTGSWEGGRGITYACGSPDTQFPSSACVVLVNWVSKSLERARRLLLMDAMTSTDEKSIVRCASAGNFESKKIYPPHSAMLPHLKSGLPIRLWSNVTHAHVSSVAVPCLPARFQSDFHAPQYKTKLLLIEHMAYRCEMVTCQQAFTQNPYLCGSKCRMAAGRNQYTPGKQGYRGARSRYLIHVFQPDQDQHHSMHCCQLNMQTTDSGRLGDTRFMCSDY